MPSSPGRPSNGHFSSKIRSGFPEHACVTVYVAEQFKKLMHSHNLGRTTAILLIIIDSWTSMMALQHTIHKASEEHGSNQASPPDKPNRN
ncbi:MAG: hypothetical protein V7742_20515 [Halioglobus sp.]